MSKFQEFDAQTGIKTTVHHIEDAGRVVIQKEYDAAPLVDMASEARARTDGEQWGDMRHVGFIPMAELGKMLRQDGTIDKKRCLEFIRKNPALATFSKVLK
jgi:predicted metal-binding protein